MSRKFMESTGSELHNQYLSNIKEFIPPLTPDLHKGQCGRIGVVGGSSEYTGAPYFAAISALKLGADLVYVFCCKEAAPIIKSYSPELIVLPILDDADAVKKIEPWLSRLHTLVIGPGLGRDPGNYGYKNLLCSSIINYVLLFNICKIIHNKIFSNCDLIYIFLIYLIFFYISGLLKNVSDIITHCQEKPEPKLPLVIDADGLHIVTENFNLIQNYNGPVILTPNAVEYNRLSAKFSNPDSLQIAASLNIILLQKGLKDIITNGICNRQLKLESKDVTIACDINGSNRRCGGQGDILSGCIATFVSWFHLNNCKKGNSDFNSVKNESLEKKLLWFKDHLMGYSWAVYGACVVTKTCNRLAFQEHGRSMTASDMITYIHRAFESFFGM